MFGKELMICPVYKYQARAREVYFPKQTGWYNLYDVKFTYGGQKQTVDAPYHRMPIYVAAGSILPIGKVIQNASQTQTDLTLYVYAGKNGKFTLYEDENVNYNYEKGAYSTISFSWNDIEKTLTIHDRKGSFPKMIIMWKFNIVLVSENKGTGIDVTEKIDKVVSYTGKKMIVKL